MKDGIRAYLSLAQENSFWAFYIGFALYLFVFQVPVLGFGHPGLKSQLLLVVGSPLPGCITMAWARWSSLQKTVPQHETIEEHK